MSDPERTYSKQEHLKFWCQTVLPLVFDDSLSYYEALCKIGSYVNNLIDDMDLTADQITEIKTELSNTTKLAEHAQHGYNEIVTKDNVSTVLPSMDAVPANCTIELSGIENSDITGLPANFDPGNAVIISFNANPESKTTGTVKIIVNSEKAYLYFKGTTAGPVWYELAAAEGDPT